MAQLDFERNKTKLQNLNNKIRLFPILSKICLLLGLLTVVITIAVFLVKPLPGLIAVIIGSIFGCICFGGSLVFLVFTFMYKYSFQSLYKETLVKGALSEVFENVTYCPKFGFTNEQVENFGLSKIGTHVLSEDYIAATYKGIAFNTSDVKIIHKSGRNSRYITYFEGRMFEFQYGKPIKGCVQILPDKFAYKPALPGSSGKLQTESLSFNKEYDVTATNPEEAFYILTPAVIETIQRLNYQYPGVMFSIIENMLYVGIPSNGNNAFDVAKSTTDINYENERKKVLDDARVIIDIIEHLSIPTISETGGVNPEMYRTTEEIASRQAIKLF